MRPTILPDLALAHAKLVHAYRSAGYGLTIRWQDTGERDEYEMAVSLSVSSVPVNWTSASTAVDLLWYIGSKC